VCYRVGTVSVSEISDCGRGRGLLQLVNLLIVCYMMGTVSVSEFPIVCYRMETVRVSEIID
jgi:hypothetical protein